MKKLQILKQCSLFKGIDPAEIEKLLNNSRKNSFLFKFASTKK